MAFLPLYRAKPYVRSFRYAKFPDDYYVIAETIIDDDMVAHPRISGFSWNLNVVPHRTCDGVAVRKETRDRKRLSIYLHRELWTVANGEIPKGLTIDHKNQQTLDNRLENLRLATYSQQHANKKRLSTASSPYQGVFYFQEKHNPYITKRWNAKVRTPGMNALSLGYYLTAEEAGLAYEIAFRHIFGDFACLDPVPLDTITPERQQEIRSIVEQKLQTRGLIPVS